MGYKLKKQILDNIGYIRYTCIVTKGMPEYFVYFKQIGTVLERFYLTQETPNNTFKCKMAKTNERQHRN